MTFTEFKEAVIARAQALGLTDYELYYQTAESTSVSAFQHELNQFTSSIDGGVCFRCIVGGKMGYASTEALNAQQAAAIVDKAADNARALEAEEAVFLGEGGKTYEKLELKPYDLPATDALIAKVLSTQEQIYQASPAVIARKSRAISFAFPGTERKRTSENAPATAIPVPTLPLTIKITVSTMAGSRRIESRKLLDG